MPPMKEPKNNFVIILDTVFLLQFNCYIEQAAANLVIACVKPFKGISIVCASRPQESKRATMLLPAIIRLKCLLSFDQKRLVFGIETSRP